MFESPPGYLASQWLAYLTAVWGTRPGHGSIPHQDDIKVVTVNVKDPLHKQIYGASPIVLQTNQYLMGGVVNITLATITP